MSALCLPFRLRCLAVFLTHSEVTHTCLAWRHSAGAAQRRAYDHPCYSECARLCASLDNLLTWDSSFETTPVAAPCSAVSNIIASAWRDYCLDRKLLRWPATCRSVDGPLIARQGAHAGTGNTLKVFKHLSQHVGAGCVILWTALGHSSTRSLPLVWSHAACSLIVCSWPCSSTPGLILMFPQATVCAHAPSRRSITPQHHLLCCKASCSFFLVWPAHGLLQ